MRVGRDAFRDTGEIAADEFLNRLLVARGTWCFEEANEKISGGCVQNKVPLLARGACMGKTEGSPCINSKCLRYNSRFLPDKMAIPFSFVQARLGLPLAAPAFEPGHSGVGALTHI